MDPKSINIFARKTLGFFLTIAAEDSENKEEHVMYRSACRQATNLLREKRVRPANVLDKLDVLADIQKSVAEVVQKEASQHGFSDLEKHEAAQAYASLVVCAALSRYGSLKQRSKTASS